MSERRYRRHNPDGPEFPIADHPDKQEPSISSVARKAAKDLEEGPPEHRRADKQEDGRDGPTWAEEIRQLREALAASEAERDQALADLQEANSDWKRANDARKRLERRGDHWRKRSLKVEAALRELVEAVSGSTDGGVIDAADHARALLDKEPDDAR